jgi:hypothetical protein
MRKLLLFVVALMCISTHVLAQTKQVAGRVTDSKGNGLEGATVKAVGEKAATFTQKDGSFKLIVKNETKQLTISSIGFTEVTVNISGQTVNVTLQESEADLNEVVVTGYNTKTKKEFGGAATVVNASAVRSIPIASFDQLLQGQAPGVVARATSGQPGASGSIQIRGRGTLIQGGTEPLYIVDGVRIAATDFALFNSGYYQKR